MSVTQQELNQVADIIIQSVTKPSPHAPRLRTWRQVEALCAAWQIPSGTLQKPHKGQCQLVCVAPAAVPLVGISLVTIRWAARGLFSVVTQ